MACNKCRQGVRSPGHTWCLSCRALEVAQLELGRRWPCQPARELAEEILLSATRHVKRLGELGPGLLTEQARYTLAFESGAARSPPAVVPPVRAGPAGPAGGEGRQAEEAVGTTPDSAAPVVAPVVEAVGGGREGAPALDEDEYTYEFFSEGGEGGRSSSRTAKALLHLLSLWSAPLTWSCVRLPGNVSLRWRT